MIAPLEDKLGLLGTRNMPTHNLRWSNKVDKVANLYCCFLQKHLSIKLQIYATSFQSHYREFARWEIFMEQELRFGLDLGRINNFWGRFFHVFMGKKKIVKNIVDGENIFGIEWI